MKNVTYKANKDFFNSVQRKGIKVDTRDYGDTIFMSVFGIEYYFRVTKDCKLLLDLTTKGYTDAMILERKSSQFERLLAAATLMNRHFNDRYTIILTCEKYQVTIRDFRKPTAEGVNRPEEKPFAFDKKQMASIEAKNSFTGFKHEKTVLLAGAVTAAAAAITSLIFSKK